MTIFPVFVALVLCYDNNMKSIWKLTNRMLLVAVAILLAAILVTPPVRSLLQPATHAAGIVPLTGLADPTPTPHTLHLPVIARSPIWFYTTSIYMKSINPTDAYNLGCAAGQADLARPGIQNSLIILDYGQPWRESGVYGVWLLSVGGFYTMDQVKASAAQFGYGYWVCTGADRSSHLTLGVGINSYGSYGTNSPDAGVRAAAARVHGEQWAQMIVQLGDIFTGNGVASQVTVAGAKDIELNWNVYQVTRAWVDGFNAYDAGIYNYYNFGACEGCPTRLLPGASPANGWSLDQIWYVSYGAAPAYPIPEIYATSGVNARQWAWLSWDSVLDKRGAIYYPGLMTQWQACQQRGCNATDNTPMQGFAQLFEELSYWMETAQSEIPWTTDIWWMYED